MGDDENSVEEKAIWVSNEDVTGDLQGMGFDEEARAEVWVLVLQRKRVGRKWMHYFLRPGDLCTSRLLIWESPPFSGGLWSWQSGTSQHHPTDPVPMCQRADESISSKVNQILWRASEVAHSSESSCLLFSFFPMSGGKGEINNSIY